MTSSNHTSAAPSATSRKSLTLIQLLALIGFGGLVASLVFNQFV